MTGAGGGGGVGWGVGGDKGKPIFALETISKKLSNSDMLWPEY